MSHVEFVRGSDTLVATGSFLVDDFLALYDVGPSVGSNLKVARRDGTVPRDRGRDELSVDIGWVIGAHTDIAGGPGGQPFRQVRVNMRALALWFDDAPGRQVLVRLVDDEFGTWEGEAHHEAWGSPDWHGATIIRRQLLTVADGLLEPAGS